jgi:hypothetical protein
MLGLNPEIDNWGHVGGMLGGLFYAWFAGPTYGGILHNIGKRHHPAAEEPRLVTLAAVLVSAVLVAVKFLMVA